MALNKLAFNGTDQNIQDGTDIFVMAHAENSNNTFQN